MGPKMGPSADLKRSNLEKASGQRTLKMHSSPPHRLALPVVSLMPNMVVRPPPLVASHRLLRTWVQVTAKIHNLSLSLVVHFIAQDTASMFQRLDQRRLF